MISTPNKMLGISQDIILDVAKEEAIYGNFANVHFGKSAIDCLS